MRDNDKIPKWIPSTKVDDIVCEPVIRYKIRLFEQTLIPCDVCGYAHEEFNQPCCYCPAQPMVSE